MMKARLMQPIDWEANTSNLYYDLVGTPTPDVLKMMLTITTPDHRLYGSDYPYQPAKVLGDNMQKLKKALRNNEQLAPYVEGIMGENARKLFHKE